MKKSFLILISLIIILFDGCTTYDDGPWLSLRSKYKRISGIWEVTKFEINGIDSLSLYNQVSNYSTIEIRLNSHSPEVSSISLDDKNGVHNLWGSIDFLDIMNNDSDSLYISLSEIDSNNNNQYIDPFKVNAYSHWKIYRLSMSELWLNTIFKNKDYYIKMNKIEKIKNW